MSRVKGGPASRRKHKKILKLAKGYRMTRHKLFSVANQAVLHAGEYAFTGRKDKKNDFRTLWIIRINAALKPFDIKYSHFIKKLADHKIGLDRKILAKLAVEHPQIFSKIVDEVKK